MPASIGIITIGLMGYYDELAGPDINEELDYIAGLHDAVLVDVRTPEEYSEGHIPGAVNIEDRLCSRSNRAYIESILADKSARIFTYCFSGARSGIAAAFIRQMGYEHVGL